MHASGSERPCALALVLIAALAPAALAHGLEAAPAAAELPFAAIDAALGDGALSPELAAVYRYFAVFAPERLPARYAGDARPWVRCATALRLAAIEAARRLPGGFGPQAGVGPDGAACPGATPNHLDSAVYPIRVHWAHPGDADAARAALRAAEDSWRVEVDELGFRAPLSDRGLCGGDDRFDIFLKRRLFSAWTAEVRADATTSWDDWATYVAIDPVWYGGAWLKPTVAHELNHAMQAADDWWEILTTLESTATFIEDLVYEDNDLWHLTVGDYQARTHLPFEYNDFYRTFFMYGAALYWQFLLDRYYAGEASFIGPTWLAMRSTARGSYFPAGANEPDFADAIESVLLPEAGATYADSALEMQRWRWFVGANDDGRHFSEGAALPPEAEVRPLALDLSELPYAESQPGAQIGGALYAELDTSGAAPGQSLRVELTGDGSATWRVEELRYDTGGAPGDWAFLSEGMAGVASVPLDGVSRVVLLFYHVPASDYDPDFYAAGSYPFDLALAVE